MTSEKDMEKRTIVEPSGKVDSKNLEAFSWKLGHLLFPSAFFDFAATAFLDMALIMTTAVSSQIFMGIFNFHIILATLPYFLLIFFTLVR